MWSLKTALASQGFTGTTSVARDLFGYRLGRIPTNVDGTDSSVSVKWWATRDPRTSFNLNVTAVGVEAFTASLWKEVDTAVHRIRQVYDSIGVALQWAWAWDIAIADAKGFDQMTTSDEVDDLLEGWANDNAGLDLYFPASWSVPDKLAGRSAQPGPCPGGKHVKGAKASVAGLLGVKQSSRSATHEVGHYFSLPHRNDDGTNLMCQSSKASAPFEQQVKLTPDQAVLVRSHCMVYM